ncbi:MAG: YqjK family protein [Thiobacillus sp.]
MNNKLAQLAERRQQLVALSAAQRAVLAYDLEPWRARLALVDRGVAAIRYVGRHPVLMMGSALVFAALRRRRIGKWLQQCLLVWQIGRRLRRD